MKNGNQMYIEFQIYDKDENLLDITVVDKVQFNIGDLTKTYDGTSEEVTYDNANQVFKVWVTEEETFKFENYTKIDARILFKNNTIMGTYIEQKFVYDSLKEVLLSDTTTGSGE